MTSPAPSREARLGGGVLVAGGMVGMNVAVYAFNIIAARLLEPRELGALTALFGIILVGTVASLGLQAATARRLAVAADAQAVEDVIDVTARVTVAASLAVGLLVAVASLVLTPALKLDGHWPVVLAGATLVPLTIMGAQSGVAQGTSRWRTLTAIYLGNGLGRVVGGSVGLLVSPSQTSAMVGIAIGSWLPVLAGGRVLTWRRGRQDSASRRPMIRESLHSTHALLAYFVLSNMDSLIARNRFDAHESGLYASGLILAKAALFFPQFVSVVLFPDLARSQDGGTRGRAVALVAGFGVLATGATAALPHLALILVGGDKYGVITDRLWLFALAGSSLAVVHLLTFDALARHAHGIVVMIWAAVVAVLAVAYGAGVDITGLVVTMACTAAVLASVVWFAPGGSSRPVGER